MIVRFPSQYGTARKVQRLVVLREEQQAQHGQRLLFAFPYLRALDARAIPALNCSRMSGGDSHLRCEVTEHLL